MPGHLLIDDHNWRGARAIPIFNSAPGLHGNLQRAKIPGIDKLYTNVERSRHSRQAHPLAPPHTLKRQVLRDRCLLDSGHGTEPLNDGFIESSGDFWSRASDALSLRKSNGMSPAAATCRRGPTAEVVGLNDSVRPYSSRVIAQRRSTAATGTEIQLKAVVRMYS